MPFVFDILAKVFKRLGASFEKLAQTPSAHQAHVQKASAGHDMAKHPDEPYYAAQYLYWIKQQMNKDSSGQQALDLGCGQGRLTLPLSKYFKHITGVDFTQSAVEAARRYAKEEGCGNADFIQSDVLTYLEAQPASSIDVVVLTEIVFFLSTYKKVLNEIFRVLKPGGSSFISFRSQYFDVLFSVKNKKWDAARLALEEREGYLWGGQTWFSWQTQEDIKALLTDYKQVHCVGIGVCSGIEGDPLATIMRPSSLDAVEQSRLQALEVRMAQEYVNNGRYILAMAKK